MTTRYHRVLAAADAQELNKAMRAAESGSDVESSSSCCSCRCGGGALRLLAVLFLAVICAGVRVALHFATDVLPTGAYATADVTWIYLASSILAAVVAHSAITAAAGVRGATIGAAIAVGAAGAALIPAAAVSSARNAKGTLAGSPGGSEGAASGEASFPSTAAKHTAVALEAASEYVAGRGTHASLFVATSRFAAAATRVPSAAPSVRAAAEALHRLRAARETPASLGPRLALLALLLGNSAVATCATYTGTVLEFLSVGFVAAYFSVTFVLACDASADSATQSALWPILVARETLAVVTGEADASAANGPSSSSPRKSSSSPSRSPRGTGGSGAPAQAGALAGISTGPGSGSHKIASGGRGDARVAPLADHHLDGSNGHGAGVGHPQTDGPYATASANAALSGRLAGNASSARGAPSDIMMTQQALGGSGGGSGLITPMPLAGPAAAGSSPAEPEQLLQSARRIFDEHNRDGSLNYGSPSPRRKGPPGGLVNPSAAAAASSGRAGAGDPQAQADGGQLPGAALFTPSARLAQPVNDFGVDDGRFHSSGMTVDASGALGTTGGTTGSFRITGDSVLAGLPAQGWGAVSSSPSAADAALLRPHRVGPSPTASATADAPLRRAKPGGRRSPSPVPTVGAGFGGSTSPPPHLMNPSAAASGGGSGFVPGYMRAKGAAAR